MRLRPVVLVDHQPSSSPALRGWLAFLLPVGIAALLVASCGGSGDEEAGGDRSTTETTASAAGGSADGSTSSEPTDVEPVDDERGATTEPDIEPVVFDDDFATSIQPIFADRCASCHSPGGPGASHWTLATVDDITAVHDPISRLVARGTMPPWPAGGDSPPFLEDRSLRDDQVQAILDWSAAGAPLDVDPDTPVVPSSPVVGLTDPDRIVAAAEPYTGSTATTDDYRCQIFDPELPDGGWITAFEFMPDAKAVVHHAIGYLMPPTARDAAAELDGSDGKPGWQCYGSSGLANDDIFLGWAPGQLPTELPEGTGLRVEPGAFLVVQIHYHYETEAPPDASALALIVETTADPELEEVVVSEYVAPAEIPCSSDESGPLCDRDAALEAAIDRYGREGVLADGLLALCGQTPADFAHMTDGIASASCEIPAALVGGTGEIISVLGHQHELGSWFRMTLNPGQPDEIVLLDIPEWDFDWQYNYVPAERIVIDADDTIQIECGWDRSLRDPDLEPAYVLWADGTNDEMCFATITTRPA